MSDEKAKPAGDGDKGKGGDKGGGKGGGDHGHHEEKMSPWGWVFLAFLGIILISYAVSMGFPSIGAGIAGFFQNLYMARQAISWTRTEFMMWAGVLIILAIASYFIKRNNDKKKAKEGEGAH